MQSEIQRKSMVNTAELRQIFPLRENTLRHVVEGDGRYPRAMTPSAVNGDENLNIEMNIFGTKKIYIIGILAEMIPVDVNITDPDNSKW